MRTTLDLPDAVFRKAKAKAALEGISLKALLTHYVSRGLEDSSHTPRPKRRSELPVIRRKGDITIPDLTAQLQSTFEEEEDLAKLMRSFRR